MNNPIQILHDDRPWGSFDRFTENESSTVKTIQVLPGKRLSLQTHRHRSEYWYVLEGAGNAEIGGIVQALTPGSEVHIPIGETHRLSAGDAGIRILEIAFGHFDEDDIVRLDDDYGRIASHD